MRTIFFAMSATFLMLLVGATSAVAHSQSPERPRILVTNDDGIRAPGIVALVVELKKIGDVIVFAPSENRSGSSLSMDLSNRMAVTPVMMEGSLFGYGVDAAPAGSALVGLEYEAAAGRPVDVVVSGINQGANVGDIGHFSGTVGAAMIGAYRGIPAVAVSADARTPDYALAAKFTARFVVQLLSRDRHPGIVYSINVPAAVASGATAIPAPMGGSYFGYGVAVEIGDTIGVAIRRFGQAVVPAGSDTEFYTGGKVTVTPLRFDWTAVEALRDLEAWNLVIP